MPGGRRTAFVSRSPASGGGCAARSMKVRLWQSMLVGRCCWCARRIGSNGISQAALSGRGEVPISCCRFVAPSTMARSVPASDGGSSQPTIHPHQP